jgi:hypothetical protein
MSLLQHSFHIRHRYKRPFFSRAIGSDYNFSGQQHQPVKVHRSAQAIRIEFRKHRQLESISIGKIF